MSIESEVKTLLSDRSFTAAEGLDIQGEDARVTAYFHDRRCLWVVIESMSGQPTGLDQRVISLIGDEGIRVAKLENVSVGDHAVCTNLTGIGSNELCELELAYRSQQS